MVGVVKQVVVVMNVKRKNDCRGDKLCGDEREDESGDDNGGGQ